VAAPGQRARAGPPPSPRRWADRRRQADRARRARAQVEHVKARCLPGGLNFPMLEEYDFRNDTVNPDLAVELKPHVTHRPYQDKSMAKMFGNGRARSGARPRPARGRALLAGGCPGACVLRFSR
jgi:DNA excision repair protein ERCC-3